MKPLIWKTHKHREDFNQCPHCNAPLRWIYVGEEWIPCDKQPTLFILHPSGSAKIIYKKQVYENCLIYKKADKRFQGEILEGNRPHFYTCEVLRKQRREYALSARS